jgi:hypothetical protein
MVPFEMLYGCRCRTSLFWNEARERKVFRLDILQEGERQVHMVIENHIDCPFKREELCRPKAKRIEF